MLMASFTDIYEALTLRQYKAVAKGWKPKQEYFKLFAKYNTGPRKNKKPYRIYFSLKDAKTVDFKGVDEVIIGEARKLVKRLDKFFNNAGVELNLVIMYSVGSLKNLVEGYAYSFSDKKG